MFNLEFGRKRRYSLKVSGIGVMVTLQFSKLTPGVRFSHPAHATHKTSAEQGFCCDALAGRESNRGGAKPDCEE